MDFNITCRTCLLVKDDADMQSVFDFENDQEFAKMIEACSETKVDRNDGLPAQICRSCSNELHECLKFKRKCETSYKTLQEMHDELQESPDGKRKWLWCPSPSQNPIEPIRRPRKSKDVPVTYRVFKDRELFEMNSNEKSIQTDEITFFACEMCDMKFVSEDALKLHGPVHQDSGFKCLVCSNMFGKLTHLRRHIATAHPVAAADDKKQYEIVCKVCDKKFARTDNLHRHMLKHTGKMNLNYKDDFECAVCGLVFRNALELSAHGKCPGRKALMENPRRPRRACRQKKTDVAEDDEEDSDLEDNDQADSEDEIDQLKVAVKTEPDTDAKDDGGEPSFTAEEVDFEEFINDVEDETYEFEEHIEDDIIEYDPTYETVEDLVETVVEPSPVKRGRGRPRKYAVETPLVSTSPKTAQKRGRPRKDIPAVGEDNKKPINKEKVNEGSDYENSESDTEKETDPETESRVKEKVRIKCKMCPKTFTRLNHLRRHIIIHSNIKPFACEVCDKRFTRMDHLSIHRHHHSAVKPFNCDICQRGFTRKSHLQKHKESRHTAGRTVKTEICTVCNKGFSTPKYLQVHMKVHLDKEFVCKFCSERFAIKEELLEHNKIHANERPYLCSECGASFVRNDYLTIHMRRHKGDKPYKCKYCDKAFPRSTDLTVHERYHTGERTHICNICGKGFQRAYNLIVHMRIHTGEKPYACTHCDKSFAQGNDLKAHVRRHTGERFKCDICGEGFIQGYHLTQHQRKMHGLDVQSHIKRVVKFIPSPMEACEEMIVDEYEGMVDDDVIPEDEDAPLAPDKREIEISVGDNQTIIEFDL